MGKHDDWGFLLEERENSSNAYNASEVSEYWRKVHSLATRDASWSNDELLPVVADPGTPAWEKRYVAHFQRRAVIRTFRRGPDVAGLQGLEFGCGTGRWVRLLNDRGARMVGIDISEDVIQRNRKAMTGTEFRSVDITRDPLESRAYDFVLSVTAIQHLPYEVQEVVFRVLVESLKPGGWFLMLENIHDKARTVFPRRINGWRRLALSHGLRCTYSGGYGFDLLPRMGHALLNARTKVKGGSSAMGPDELANATYERYRSSKQQRRYGVVFRPLVTASYVVEPLSQWIIPSRWATHSAFIFRKGS